MSFGWGLVVLGYYPQGRGLLLGAIDAFILALILYVSVMTVIDYLRILSYITNQKSKSFKIDHELVENSLKKPIIGFAILFFIISYLKNINVYDDLAAALQSWVNVSRQLGDSTFTFRSILLFIADISVAVYIANLLNKALDTDNDRKQSAKRTSIGSIMLLLRFTIICTGFLIGIIASGLPVTQLTVLMGALGVGIGFGLQNIFNNLVSGLIIAIEKPLAVGDMVELGNDIGLIQQIGIRSSNIETFDGAEIIVPNGELISNKVINWTLSSKRRRLQINLGVAYKSDPMLVKKLVDGVLNTHTDILKKPEPAIFFNEFGENALEFCLLFWISDFSEIRRIRSEVLFEVFEVLKQNNIEIPFPQRDLHLRSVDENVVIQQSKPQSS